VNITIDHRVPGIARVRIVAIGVACCTDLDTIARNIGKTAADDLIVLASV